MANKKASLKSAIQSEKRRIQNSQVKQALKTNARTLREMVGRKEKEQAKAHFLVCQKALAKAGSKGIIHKRNAARRIGRLMKMVHGLELAG